MPTPDRLSLTTKLAFGAPGLPGAAMLMTAAVHATRFYSDVVLAPLGAVALVTAIARAFDAITDPFMGWLSDRTRTRWGRRRPFIALGMVPMAVSFWLFLTPPSDLTGNAAAVWFGVVFCGAFLFSTVTSIPGQALGAELSLDYHERSSIFGIRSVFGAAGMILGAVMPGVLEGGFKIDDERLIFSGLAAFYATLFVVLNTLMVFVVRERPEFVARESNPFIPGVRRALRNRPFRILLSAGIVNAIPAAIPAILVPYFTYYAIRPEDPATWLGLFLFAYLGAGFVSLPVWMMIASRWGKLRTIVVSSVMGIGGSLLFFFADQGDTTYALQVYLFTGLASGALPFIIPAMGADTIDYDELRTGKRREAQFGAFWTMIPKFVSIPGSSIPLAILSVVGYVPNVAQTPEVVFTIKFLYSIFPAAFYVVALLIVMRYPITAQVHGAIRDGIEAHLRGESAIDPITGETLASPHVDDQDADDRWFLDYFSPRELRRSLRDGPGQVVRDVLVANVGVATALVASVAVAVASVGGVGTEPGPAAVFGVVAAGAALTALCFQLGRIRPARRFGRAPVDAERIRAHLASLAGSQPPTES